MKRREKVYAYTQEQIDDLVKKEGLTIKQIEKKQSEGCNCRLKIVARTREEFTKLNIPNGGRWI